MYVRGAPLFFCCLLLVALACSRGEKKAAANPAGSGACALLSASDIQVVQGEAVADTQGSERSNDEFVMSQCFYRLPTFSKSVSLEVMRPAGAGESARVAEEFWERRFGKGREEEDREREAERESEKKREGEGKGERKEEGEREQEKGVGPQPVAGLGSEAFWTGNQLNGSLYVRKNNAIVRLSIGGPEDQSTKIKKTTALAEQVLKRL